MELCDGNLEGFMQQRNFMSATPITIAEVWNIMTQITNGLVYVHAQNEIHGVLKPSNGMYAVELNWHSQYFIRPILKCGRLPILDWRVKERRGDSWRPKKKTGFVNKDKLTRKKVIKKQIMDVES